MCLSSMIKASIQVAQLTLLICNSKLKFKWKLKTMTMAW
jgi:hypothetical protein